MLPTLGHEVLATEAEIHSTPIMLAVKRVFLRGLMCGNSSRTSLARLSTFATQEAPSIPSSHGQPEPSVLLASGRGSCWASEAPCYYQFPTCLAPPYCYSRNESVPPAREISFVAPGQPFACTHQESIIGEPLPLHHEFPAAARSCETSGGPAPSWPTGRPLRPTMLPGG